LKTLKCESQVWAIRPSLFCSDTPISNTAGSKKLLKCETQSSEMWTKEQRINSQMSRTWNPANGEEQCALLAVESSGSSAAAASGSDDEAVTSSGAPRTKTQLRKLQHRTRMPQPRMLRRLGCYTLSAFVIFLLLLVYLPLIYLDGHKRCGRTMHSLIAPCILSQIHCCFSSWPARLDSGNLP